MERVEWKETYSRETEGKIGLACLISLCPCPCDAAPPDEEEAEEEEAGAPEDPCLTSTFFFSAFSAFGASASASLAGAAEELDEPGGERSLGISRDARSSPSSARTAIIWPTGILELPASV